MSDVSEFAQDDSSMDFDLAPIGTSRTESSPAIQNQPMTMKMMRGTTYLGHLPPNPSAMKPRCLVMVELDLQLPDQSPRPTPIEASGLGHGW